MVNRAASLDTSEPTSKWEARYRKVRDAAANAFAERGYLGASTTDIADQLGIKAGSLYYYIPSKEAALAAVCEHGIVSFIEYLRCILASPISAELKVRATIENQLSPLTRPEGDYVRVFLRHRHELPEELRRPIVNLSREYQTLVQRIFEEGVARGEFRGDLNPQLAMLALLGLCNSVIAAHSLSKAVKIDALIDEYFQIFVSGVRGPAIAQSSAKIHPSAKIRQTSRRSRTR